MAKITEDLKDTGTRQVAAAWTAGLAGIGIPLLYALGSILLVSWLRGAQQLGWNPFPNLHQTFYGWLTSYQRHPALYNKNDHLMQQAGIDRSVNAIPLAWLMAWATAYVLYQLCELVAWPIRLYVGAARDSKRSVMEDASSPDGIDDWKVTSR